MAGTLERELQKTSSAKEPLPRYRLKSPSGSIPVIIIDTNRVLRDSPNLERVAPPKPHVKK